MFCANQFWWIGQVGRGKYNLCSSVLHFSISLIHLLILQYFKVLSFFFFFLNIHKIYELRYRNTKNIQAQNNLLLLLTFAVIVNIYIFQICFLFRKNIIHFFSPVFHKPLRFEYNIYVYWIDFQSYWNWTYKIISITFNSDKIREHKNYNYIFFIYYFL